MVLACEAEIWGRVEEGSLVFLRVGEEYVCTVCTYVRTLSTTWDGNTFKTEFAIPSDRESANTVGNQTGNERGIQSIRDGHDEIRYSLGLGSGSFGCDWPGYTIAGSTSSGTFVIRFVISCAR